MIRSAWLAAAAAGLLVVGGIALVLLASDDGRGPAVPEGAVAAAVADATPAAEPFPALTETTIRVGARTLDVVVADEAGERTQGLRGRRHLGAYDGMLFVFEAPTQTPFTMSTVPVPLDIGFYDADGSVVDRLRMQPCPIASEARCASYRASGPFSYALETLVGDLPTGRLATP